MKGHVSSQNLRIAHESFDELTEDTKSFSELTKGRYYAELTRFATSVTCSFYFCDLIEALPMCELTEAYKDSELIQDNCFCELAKDNLSFCQLTKEFISCELTEA